MKDYDRSSKMTSAVIQDLASLHPEKHGFLIFRDEERRNGPGYEVVNMVILTTFFASCGIVHLVSSTYWFTVHSSFL